MVMMVDMRNVENRIIIIWVERSGATSFGLRPHSRGSTFRALGSEASYLDRHSSWKAQTNSRSEDLHYLFNDLCLFISLELADTIKNDPHVTCKNTGRTDIAFLL